MLQGQWRGGRSKLPLVYVRDVGYNPTYPTFFGTFDGEGFHLTLYSDMRAGCFFCSGRHGGETGSMMVPWNAEPKGDIRSTILCRGSSPVRRKAVKPRQARKGATVYGHPGAAGKLDPLQGIASSWRHGYGK